MDVTRAFRPSPPVPGLRSHRALRRACAFAVVVLGAVAVTACARHAPLASSTTARAANGRAGDTAAFDVRIVGVAYAPDRLSLRVARPAFVTVVAVTPDRIVPLLPTAGTSSEAVPDGERTMSLEVQGGDGRNRVAERFPRSGAADDAASAAAVMEYNRCLANARRVNEARKRTERRQVGTDSLGRPVFETVVVDDPSSDPRHDAERQCREPDGSVGRLRAPDASHGGTRMLFVFASDTPVSQQNVVDLAIPEGDARSIAAAIGGRLFTARGGRWAAAYAPW